MADFLELKKRMQELKPKVISKKASQAEVEEYDKILKDLAQKSPAKLSDI